MDTEVLIKGVRTEEARLQAMQALLVMHARQQEYVEQRYNELLHLTRDAIALILVCPVQRPMPACWIQQRDALVQRVRCFLDGDKEKEETHAAE